MGFLYSEDINRHEKGIPQNKSKKQIRKRVRDKKREVI
jgi:hypothetical protein